MVTRLVQILVRLTGAEKAAFQRDAGRQGVTLNTLARMRMLQALPIMERTLLLGDPEMKGFGAAPSMAEGEALQGGPVRTREGF